MAARRYGTPLYLMDGTSLDAASARATSAFPDPWLRHYSVKANDVTGVVRRLGELGWGANVVSRGEWSVALAAGLPNERITLEGVGKTEADLRAAVRAAQGGRPLRWVALESVDEAVALARMVRRTGTSLDVLLRLNPDVTPETHRGLSVGTGAAKFGLTEAEIGQAIEVLAATARSGAAGIVVRGLQIHVGSQLGAVDAWREGARKGLALLALLRGSVPSFDTIDLGGGFPVAPVGAASPGPERFAAQLPALLDALPADRRLVRLSIEPGRWLVARAGWLVARVLHVRDRGGAQVVLDAGMTELIRPALYGATHEVEPLTSLGRPVDGEGRTRRGTTLSRPTRVEGPICESTDELGTHDLPTLRRGDLVAIRDAGAYAASQGSTYNGRPRPPQVLLEPDGRLVLLRRRGTLGSLG